MRQKGKSLTAFWDVYHFVARWCWKLFDLTSEVFLLTSERISMKILTRVMKTVGGNLSESINFNTTCFIKCGNPIKLSDNQRNDCLKSPYLPLMDHQGAAWIFKTKGLTHKYESKAVKNSGNGSTLKQPRIIQEILYQNLKSMPCPKSTGLWLTTVGLGYYV